MSRATKRAHFEEEAEDDDEKMVDEVGESEEEGEEEEGEEEEGEEEEGEEEDDSSAPEEDDSSNDDGLPIGTRKRPAGSRVVDSSEEEGAHLDSPGYKQQKS